MRIGCLPWIIGLVLVVYGGQKLYTGISNRKQVEIAIGDLIQEKPDSKWLKVTGGHLSILNGAYTESRGGGSRELYIPLITEDSEGSPIHVLLHTKDPEIMQMSLDLQSLENAGEAQVLAKLAELGPKLFPQKDVEGLVEYGLETGRDQDKVKDLFQGELADDCLIIEDGKKPSAALGALMTLGGFGVLGGMAAFSARNKAAAA